MSFQVKTEEQKIQKLITYVAGLKDAVFIRNGSEYAPSKAAAHLKMKREKAGSSIKTAIDFIEELASKSSMTGQDYTVKFKDGKVVKVRDLLMAELKRIK
jgi:hypothetical protein